MARIHRRPRSVHHPVWLISSIFCLTSTVLFGERTARAESEPSSEQTDAGPSPEGAPIEGESDALSRDELTDLCIQLASAAEEERQASAVRIIAAGASSVPTISERLRRDLRSAPAELEDLLEDVADGRSLKRLPPREEDPPLDALSKLLAAERGGSNERALKEVTEVVVLLRALSEARTTKAVGAMLRYSPRERGVFRPEIARNSKRTGDAAIPALIRNTRHPNGKVAEFSTELLQWLRKSTPGTQVQVRDPAVRAEILTVYGEHGDRDTIPVLLSFSGSENSHVREAARSAVMSFGRAILWPAKIKYENFTGEEPRRDWRWRELAKRLFDAQDQARMNQAEQTMERGIAHAADEQWEEMMGCYDEILGRWHQYERRAEMVPGMVSYAVVLDGQGKQGRARELMHQALLLDPSGERSQELRGKLLQQEIEAELERGVADILDLRRLEALGHDPEEVEELMNRIRDRSDSYAPGFYKSVAAIGLALFGFACLGFLVMRQYPKPTRTRQGKGEASD